MFMDALSAAAPVGKKDSNKKRKRRISSSSTKDASGHDDSATEPTTPTTPTTPNASPPKITAPKFYQDTLDDTNEEDVKETKDEKNDSILSDSMLEDEDEDDIPLKRLKETEDEKSKLNDKKDVEIKKEEPEEIEEVGPKPPGPGCGPNGPPGVLVIHRRRGPKKQLKWRPQESLEEVRYFELDETERVNVTKTFTDAKLMERCMEREAIVNVRSNKYAHDRMEADMDWMPLVEVDGVPPHPDGAQSKEKKIQFDREQTVLKVLYFSRHMVPDSPSEPDMEYYQITDPQIIPLDDITRNPDAVNDLTNMAWPDPKVSPQHIPGGLGLPFNMGPLNNAPFIPMMTGNDMPIKGGGWPAGMMGNNPLMPMGPNFNLPAMAANMGGPQGMGMPGMGGPGMGGSGMGGPGMGGPNIRGSGMINSNMGGPNMGGPNMGGPNMNGPNMGGPGMMNGPGLNIMNGPNMNGPGMGGPGMGGPNNGQRNNGPGPFNNMNMNNGPPQNQNNNWFRPGGPPPPPNWINKNNHGPRGFNNHNNGPRNWGGRHNNNRFDGGGGRGGRRDKFF